MYFDKDIFLKTDFPVAVDSPDHWDIHGGSCHYTDGEPFGKYLLQYWPEKKTLIDLGTASGSIPMTMRKVGLLSVGLEGSDAAKKRKIHAWELMPDIVRTCDISRPFEIVDINNKPVKFDYVISYATIEHIQTDRLKVLWQNIRNMMNADTIGIFNIDLGVNKYHLSGGWTPKMWQDELEANNFEVMHDWTFDVNGNFQYHPYCHPDVNALKVIFRDKLPFYSGRTFWWVRLKK